MPLIGHCSPRLPEETVTRLLIDITNCNASNTSGCTQTPKQVVFPGSTLWQGGAASVPFGFPSFLDLDETTHTLSTYPTPTKVRFTSLIHRPVTAARRLVAVPS